METWTFSWALRNLCAEFLMPPGLWILLALLGLFLFKHRQTLQRVTVVVSLAMIWVCSTPVFAGWLAHQLNGWMDWPAPLNMADLPTAHPQAIVVLGGGRRVGAVESPEYDYQDLSKESAERVRFAAKLAKKTGKAILTSGGMPDQSSDKDRPEAQIMSWVLKNEYGLDTKWVEAQSATTQENAVYSAKLLQSEHVQHIYLVTDVWHMPRAQKIFEQQGLMVTPAAHGYEELEHLSPLDFYPRALAKTRQIWHEAIGMMWYRLRY